MCGEDGRSEGCRKEQKRNIVPDDDAKLLLAMFSIWPQMDKVGTVEWQKWTLFRCFREQVALT